MFFSSDYTNYSTYEPFTQEVGFELKQQELKPVMQITQNHQVVPEQEHTTTQKITNAISNNIGTTIGIYIGLSLLALFIAYQRNELYYQNPVNGQINLNLSLILCIIFFHQFYFMYVVFDFLLKPNHFDII